MIDLEAFQALNGLDFVRRELLIRSLTHTSYVNEHPEMADSDNERLEFLGDAVLDFISGEWLYSRFPDGTEGDLTRLRAALVRTERLAGFAKQCRIGEALMLGHGEEESGGRERPGNLCAAFEAVVGALFLDQGIERVRTFVVPFFEPALEEVLRLDLDRDAKSLLQEWCQANLGLTPSYTTISSEGPDHAKHFTVGVSVGVKRLAEGDGFSKQAAAQAAAQRALNILQATSHQ